MRLQKNIYLEHRILDLDIDHECIAEEEIVTRLTVQEQICWIAVTGLEEKKINKRNKKIKTTKAQWRKEIWRQ